MPPTLNRIAHRARRLWLTEALLVAAILLFGGFALLSDAKLSPAQLATGVNQFLTR